MKVLWILGQVTALTLLMALGGAGACAQVEIDQDHFDSLNTEPFGQPTSHSQEHATRYDGNFSLPYALQCRGKQWAPGKYSISLRSDGKFDHGVLKSKRQFIEITSVVHPPGFPARRRCSRGREQRQSSNAIRHPSWGREFCVRSDLQTGRNTSKHWHWHWWVSSFRGKPRQPV